MTENLSPSLSPPDRNDETVFARLEAELSAFPLPEDRGDAIPFPPKAKEGAGIGELSEKSIHQMLKCCYAPDPTQREVKIGRFVADVYDGRRVAEIQTGQPGRLLPKLRFFLSEGLPVTVVYPMAGIKHLRWIDPETGEITKPRKSGKKERPIDAFHALYPLRELLLHPGLTVELLFFELDEYRLLCGYARERKKGSARIERIPRKLLCRKTLYLAEDYLRIFEEIPNLSEPFTAADLQKAAKLRSRPAYSVAHLLEALGLLKKVGMQKRAQLYGRCGSASSAPSAEADVHICDLKRNQI